MRASNASPCASFRANTRERLLVCKLLARSIFSRFALSVILYLLSLVWVAKMAVTPHWRWARRMGATRASRPRAGEFDNMRMAPASCRTDKFCGTSSSFSLSLPPAADAGCSQANKKKNTCYVVLICLLEIGQVAASLLKFFDFIRFPSEARHAFDRVGFETFRFELDIVVVVVAKVYAPFVRQVSAGARLVTW